MARLGSIMSTNRLIDETIKRAESCVGTDDLPFEPFKAVKEFSGAKIGDMNKVLSALELPAAVIVYDGSGFNRGRAPTRAARVALIAKPAQLSTPLETSRNARDQLDALVRHMDEHRVGNGTWFVTMDAVAEGKDGQVYFYATFEIQDH